MSNDVRRQRAIVLTVIFAIAMIMGPGPGMYLANTANPVFGLPALYVWGLLWYAVEVAVVIAAFFLVWSDDNGADETADK